MTDDQPVTPVRRRAIHAVGDLVIRAAHADQHPSYQEPALLGRRLRHVLDDGGSLGSRDDGHRAHAYIVVTGSRAASSILDDVDPARVIDHRSMLEAHDRTRDVVVIGAGPAGTVAALRAARLGARTTLITRDRFGGMAANDGPVPVRALAHAARLIREARQLHRYGVDIGALSIDYPRLLGRVGEVVDEVRRNSILRDELEQAGVAIPSTPGRSDSSILTPWRSRTGRICTRSGSSSARAGSRADCPSPAPS